MKIKTMLAVAALLTISLFSVAAFANTDTITFTLTNPDVSVYPPGGGVTFDATVSAPSGNSGDVFLNGDSFSVDGPLTLDDSDFFANFPLSLAPGASFTGDLFVVTVPPGTLDGAYLGSFTLLGGADGGAQDSLGTVNFSVNVPEPSSISLLLAGIAGFLLWGGLKGNLRGWAL